MNYHRVKLLRTLRYHNFELDAFVDVNNKEKASEWFKAFELRSKTTMLKTKRYDIKGKCDISRDATLYPQ